MKRKVTVIIASGGKGKRFYHNSNSRPKQYINLHGKPVILYSLLTFQNSGLTDEIIVTASPEYFDFIHKLSLSHKITKLSKLTDGGSTRFLSVRNAFRQTDCRQGDIIIIHDAARPNISVKFVDHFIRLALKYKNLVSGVKINSTVKRARKNRIYETVDRTNLWEIQTPQAFTSGTLKHAYSTVKGNDFTDESSLVHTAGIKVRITDGERFNLKITTLDDLKLLSKIIKP